MTSSQHTSRKTHFLQVEQEILKDTNARGDLIKLAKWGDLEKIVTYLTFLKSSSTKEKCLILTGFPCIEASLPFSNDSMETEKRNVQETDGIAGAVAVARVLGPNKCIIGIEGDNENPCKSVQYSASYSVKRVLENLGEDTINFSNDQKLGSNKKFQILSLPTVRQQQNRKYKSNSSEELLKQLGPYSILSIEKAGYSKVLSTKKEEKESPNTSLDSSRAYTMKGRDITLDCAPVVLIKQLWDNATLRMSIGDGGNELGLGLVNELTCKYVPLGEKIACDPGFSADHLLISGVSNWGGYAVALGMLSNELHPEQELGKELLSEKTENNVADTLRELGVCDGVTGESKNCTVDGISFHVHMQLFETIRRILNPTHLDNTGLS